VARNNHNGNNTAERTWQNVVMTQSENKLAQRWQKRRTLTPAGGWKTGAVAGGRGSQGAMSKGGTGK